MSFYRIHKINIKYQDYCKIDNLEQSFIIVTSYTARKMRSGDVVIMQPYDYSASQPYEDYPELGIVLKTVESSPDLDEWESLLTF